MSKNLNHIAVLSSTALCVVNGDQDIGSKSVGYPNVDGKVACFAFSSCGKRFAWISNSQVTVVESPSWEVTGTLNRPKARDICFSPNATYLAIWEIPDSSQGSSTDNLSIYDIANKKILKSYNHSSQTDWKLSWSQDESIMARQVASEAHFYKISDLETPFQKKSSPELKSFSLSPSAQNHLVIFFMQGTKNSPCLIQLFKYPNINGSPLSSKSFFKVQSIEVFWNKQATAALILTMMQSDKNSNSYYGEQMLFYMNKKGDSIRVTFSKSGNIHSLCWCPNGKSFFAVYGNTPAKATWFNEKCDSVAQFGEGARNIVLVNSVGNLVMIGGYGNISSRFEIWDIEKRSLIAKKECPDITQFEWSPCGKYLLTATCAPRLRVSNGYRIWHYTTTLLHECMMSEGTELYSATWQPNSEISTPFTVSSSPVKGIELKIKTASTQRYIPPSLKGIVGGAKNEKAPSETRYLSQLNDEEPGDAPSVAKEKKKKKKSKEEQENVPSTKKREELKKSLEAAPLVVTDSGKELDETEKTKKIRSISKKLKDIERMKAQQASGKKLEKEQMQKIGREAELLEELKGLSVSS